MILRQGTATTISLGPFVDESDGVTAETGLSLAVLVSKNGGAAAARNSSASIVHDLNGYYRVALDATDTAAVGQIRVMASPAGALPVWRDGVVWPAAVYDALIAGTANLPAEAVAVAAGAIDGDALAVSAGAELADAVWDEALSGHLLAGSAGAALSSSGGSGADPWATAVPGSYAAGTAGWLLGNRLDAKVSAVGGSSPGAGAVELTYTLTDSETGDPIADADIWATTDTAGSNIVASGRTDQAGQVTFYLDSGTIYLWRQKSGWDFANPDSVVVA